MSTSLALIEGVVVMLSVILLAILLKKINILRKEHSTVFSHLVLKVTLPALIFSSLAMTQFHTEFLMMALIMAALEVGCIILAMIIARLLRLGHGETGALILVSAFGMTAMLGYPIISQVFPGNSLSMEEAVVTSELGVGLLLFILGPLIAMHYGHSAINTKDLARSVKSFFLSPIFIALVAGIGISLLNFNTDDLIFQIINRILTPLGNANTFLVAMAVGLIIEIGDARRYIHFIAIVVAIKLIIKPLAAYWAMRNPEYTDMMREVVFIESAMPSAMLGAVFAKHYNCKPELVSTAVMVTLIVSLVTVNTLFFMLF